MAMHKRATGRIFFDSMLPLFIIFIALNFFVFILFGHYAPIILVAVQLAMIFFSDKIIARLGDWSISQRNPSIHLLQYHLPVEEYRILRQKYGINKIIEMKREIYEKTLAVKGELDCQTAQEVFAKYGIDCKPENLSAKKVNVYQLVKRAAEKFNLPIPKIALSNTMLPNAAATGISPSRGTILITTGLLVQLEEDEIFSVLGHEFSHLKGRDPIILFALTISEYLFRVYVFFPFIFTLPSFTLLLLFQYLYFPIAMGAIYFIGKFLESRADLESAIKIGEPKVLAEALRKIGFRRLQFERIPAYRIQGWIGWDPHPPTYFRIGRLEKMETPTVERHLLIKSVKDVIDGFRAALRPS
jgi:heat shock protein HtpX